MQKTQQFPEVDDEHIWCEVRNSTPNLTTAPALFLDRDGVVVEEVNYLHREEDCHLIPGAAEIISKAKSLGWFTVIVTNQAGIARGMYGWSEFEAVQKKLLCDLSELGASIDAVYACPHHAKGTGDYHHIDHPARKPNPGMLLRAGKALPIDMANSWIIGDRASDISAGRNAGLAGGIQVLTGHGSRDGETAKALAEARDSFTVHSVPSIAEAADAIRGL